MRTFLLAVALGVSVGASASTLARYSLAGRLVQVLGQQANWVSAIYTPDGTELAVSAGEMSITRSPTPVGPRPSSRSVKF